MKYYFIILTFFVQLAFAQDYAIQHLEDSPRHHEWVQLKSGERTVHAFVAYPEVAENAQAIIVIHENRGLTDWVRCFADELAEMGYLAIAPDLLSESEEGITKTSDFNSSDDARNAIYRLDPEQVTTDLKETFKYIKSAPGSNGSVSVIGFCWGGSQSFRFATNEEGLRRALVFYGSGPKEQQDYNRIKMPVYGFYGENDQRVNATIEDSKKMMINAEQQHDIVIYSGAGHAFQRAGADPNGSEANKKAADAAKKRIAEIME